MSVFQGISHFIVSGVSLKPTLLNGAQGRRSLPILAVLYLYVTHLLLSPRYSFFVCLFASFLIPHAGHFNSIIIFKAVINTQWLRKRRILVATTKLQFKDSRGHCLKHIFKYSFVTQSTKYLIAHGFPGVPFQERGAGQRTARSPGRTTFPLRCRSPWAPVFRRCTSSFS